VNLILATHIQNFYKMYKNLTYHKINILLLLWEKVSQKQLIKLKKKKLMQKSSKLLSIPDLTKQITVRKYLKDQRKKYNQRFLKWIKSITYEKLGVESFKINRL